MYPSREPTPLIRQLYHCKRDVLIRGGLLYFLIFIGCFYWNIKLGPGSSQDEQRYSGAERRSWYLRTYRKCRVSRYIWWMLERMCSLYEKYYLHFFFKQYQQRKLTWKLMETLLCYIQKFFAYLEDIHNFYFSSNFGSVFFLLWLNYLKGFG